jgi:hypothetical protein
MKAFQLISAAKASERPGKWLAETLVDLKVPGADQLARHPRIDPFTQVKRSSQVKGWVRTHLSVDCTDTVLEVNL